MEPTLPRTALTIAGHDSSSGAGVGADLKTFSTHGVYGLAAVTSITAQNAREVLAVQHASPEIVAQQIYAVAKEFQIGATKSGMLATAAIVEAVADRIAYHKLNPFVLDPVMVSESGAKLLDEDATQMLIAKLLPLSTLVTPNIAEAEAMWEQQRAKTPRPVGWTRPRRC